MIGRTTSARLVSLRGRRAQHEYEPVHSTPDARARARMATDGAALWFNHWCGRGATDGRMVLMISGPWSFHDLQRCRALLQSHTGEGHLVVTYTPSTSTPSGRSVSSRRGALTP